MKKRLLAVLVVFLLVISTVSAFSVEETDDDCGFWCKFFWGSAEARDNRGALVGKALSIPRFTITDQGSNIQTRDYVLDEKMRSAVGFSIEKHINNYAPGKTVQQLLDEVSVEGFAYSQAQIITWANNDRNKHPLAQTFLDNLVRENYITQSENTYTANQQFSKQGVVAWSGQSHHKNTYNHEVSHVWWQLDPEYATAGTQWWRSLPDDIKNDYTEQLEGWGYDSSSDGFPDEAVAFFYNGGDLGGVQTKPDVNRDGIISRSEAILWNGNRPPNEAVNVPPLPSAEPVAPPVAAVPPPEPAPEPEAEVPEPEPATAPTATLPTYSNPTGDIIVESTPEAEEMMEKLGLTFDSQTGTLAGPPFEGSPTDIISVDARRLEPSSTSRLSTSLQNEHGLSLDNIPPTSRVKFSVDSSGNLVYTETLADGTTQTFKGTTVDGIHNDVTNQYQPNLKALKQRGLQRTHPQAEAVQPSIPSAPVAPTSQTEPSTQGDFTWEESKIPTDDSDLFGVVSGGNVMGYAKKSESNLEEQPLYDISGNPIGSCERTSCSLDKIWMFDDDDNEWVEALVTASEMRLMYDFPEGDHSEDYSVIIGGDKPTNNPEVLLQQSIPQLTDYQKERLTLLNFQQEQINEIETKGEFVYGEGSGGDSDSPIRVSFNKDGELVITSINDNTDTTQTITREQPLDYTLVDSEIADLNAFPVATLQEVAYDADTIPETREAARILLEGRGEATPTVTGAPSSYLPADSNLAGYANINSPPSNDGEWKQFLSDLQTVVDGNPSTEANDGPGYGEYLRETIAEARAKGLISPQQENDWTTGTFDVDNADKILADAQRLRTQAVIPEGTVLGDRKPVGEGNDRFSVNFGTEDEPNKYALDSSGKTPRLMYYKPGGFLSSGEWVDVTDETNRDGWKAKLYEEMQLQRLDSLGRSGASNAGKSLYSQAAIQANAGNHVDAATNYLAAASQFQTAGATADATEALRSAADEYGRAGERALQVSTLDKLGATQMESQPIIAANTYKEARDVLLNADNNEDGVTQSDISHAAVVTLQQARAYAAAGMDEEAERAITVANGLGATQQDVQATRAAIRADADDKAKEKAEAAASSPAQAPPEEAAPEEPSIIDSILGGIASIFSGPDEVEEESATAPETAAVQSTATSQIEAGRLAKELEDLSEGGFYGFTSDSDERKITQIILMDVKTPEDLADLKRAYETRNTGMTFEEMLEYELDGQNLESVQSHLNDLNREGTAERPAINQAEAPTAPAAQPATTPTSPPPPLSAQTQTGFDKAISQYNTYMASVEESRNEAETARAAGKETLADAYDAQAATAQRAANAALAQAQKFKAQAAASSTDLDALPLINDDLANKRITHGVAAERARQIAARASATLATIPPATRILMESMPAKRAIVKGLEEEAKALQEAATKVAEGTDAKTRAEAAAKAKQEELDAAKAKLEKDEKTLAEKLPKGLTPEQIEKLEEEAKKATEAADRMETQGSWLEGMPLYSVFTGDTEPQRVMGGIVSLIEKAGSYRALSNLLVPGLTKTWMEAANSETIRNWANLPSFIATRSGLFPDACSYDDAKMTKTPGQTSAFVETVSGTYQSVGAIHAEMYPGSPTLPIPCSINPDEEAEEQWLCSEDLLCKPDGFCYESELSEEPAKGYFYKITWGITAPQDETFTPYVDENNITIKFNLKMDDKWLFRRRGVSRNAAIELTNGNSDGGTIVRYLQKKYAQVCIVWHPDYRIKDTSGEFVPNLCADFIETARGEAKYGSSASTTSSSVPSSSAEVEMDI